MLRTFRQSRLLMIIMAASSLINLSFSLYRSVFNNFAAQELGIDPGRYGLLEGIRELPGLLTIVLAALGAAFSDERVYAISASLIGIGIWLYSTAASYSDLIYATLVQSTGFHLWQVVQDSMVMKSVATGDRARRLGQLNSAAAAATLVGMGAVWMFSKQFGLRPFFMWAGIAGVLGAGVSLLFKPTPVVANPPRFVFRWRYRSYYVLMLLSGARRHMVLTFAAFALVKIFNTSAQTMALLLAVNSFLAIWTRPLIGKLIDQAGEQRALSVNYAIVAAVFLGYAFVQVPWFVYGLFVIDNLLVGFDIAISTHAGRIIPKEELSSSLATGLTINHIFGVAVPIVGGLLWEWFGPVVPFVMGTVIVLIAMTYSWNLDVRTEGRADESTTA